MRVVHLAAGAGGMYCGSCMRDNRLAATLVKTGRDVVLVPLYTPLRTDETDVSTGRVLFGGLNVFLEQRLGFFRHRLGPIDRWLDSRLLLRAIGKLASRTRAEDLGPLTVSVLRGADGHQRKELARLLDSLRGMQPDLLNLPNLMFLGQAGVLRRELNVPIVCTLSGEDIFLDRLPAPYRQQALDLIRDRAADVDAFVPVTRYFARRCVEHFGLPADRMHVIPMGINAADFARDRSGGGGGLARDRDDPFVIGYLARICPEKGLRVLADAFITLRRDGRNCRLRIAGFVGIADRPYLDETLAHLRAAGLIDSVDFLGEVSLDGKRAFLHGLHALSVPSIYPEAKGFYILEALAAGVPVVQPDRGSFPELIEATGGGVLFDPQHDRGLADALARLMDDETQRQTLARAGCEAVNAGYSAEGMADASWSLFERLVAARRGPSPTRT